MRFKKYIFFLLLVLSLKSYGEINDSIVLAESFYNKGIYFGKKGILDSAFYYGNKSLEVFEQIENIDSVKLANAYQSMGIIGKLLGKYNNAIDCYNKAEEIYKSEQKKFLLAFIYSNKANIYSIQQDYTKAKDFNIHSLNILNKDSIKYAKNISITYNNLGSVFRKQFYYEDAIKCYKKSIEIAQKSGNKTKAIGNLALLYMNINEFEKADYYFIRNLELINSENEVYSLNSTSTFQNYAIFLSLQKKENKALKYFNSTLSIFQNNFGNKHPQLSNTFNDLGEHYLRFNKLDSALLYFQKSLIATSKSFNSLDINTNPLIDSTLSNIQLLKALKNKAATLSQIAIIEKESDLFRLSLETYDLAISVINKIRSGYLSEESKLFLADNEFETFSNALETSYELYNLTKEKKYVDKAFIYSESGKAAILAESIKKIQAQNIGGIPDSLINNEKQLEKSIWNYEELIYEENKKKKPNTNKLQYWNKYLFEQKQEYDKLSKYLETNFQKYFELKHKSETININQIKNIITKDEILIEYDFSKDYLYTFVIDNSELNVYRQKIDQSFHQNLDTLLKSLSNNNFSYHGMKEFETFQRSSNFMYNTLLGSIKSKTKNKNIIIIPDGKLAYLPFDILISEIKPYDKINYRDLPYAILNSTFSYTHTANFLLKRENIRRTSEKSLVAFAPTYNNIDSLNYEILNTRQEYREKLFPLKGIKEEAIKISELINGDKFLDFEANENKFKEIASDYDILHLAMHTIVNDENPMYSKMAFTQIKDSIEDSFLNTFELYNMKLNSRMTVLSSCNTGNGVLHRGEGVMSMARGFIYAGCPSLVMTLWSVEDKSGVDLMTQFYKYLKEGENKSESLRKSKLDFIKNADQLRAHPYFWSGYVVIGNNDSLFRSIYFYIKISASIIILFSLLFIYFKRFRLKN